MQLGQPANLRILLKSKTEGIITISRVLNPVSNIWKMMGMSRCKSWQMRPHLGWILTGEGGRDRTQAKAEAAQTAKSGSRRSVVT